MYQFDWSILFGPSGRLLLEGAAVTLQLALASLVLALVLGGLIGFLRWLAFPLLRPVLWFYVEMSRNTPPLVQILFWYFSATVVLPDSAIIFLRDHGFQFAAATFALGVYHSGFVAEIVRGGLNAIPRGQYEAAQAIGLSLPQTIRSILIPQLLRIITPTLTNESVSLIKNTSLALAIGVTEITYQARHIDVYTFRGVEALFAVTVFYLVVCLSVAGIGYALQRFLSRNRRAAA